MDTEWGEIKGNVVCYFVFADEGKVSISGSVTQADDIIGRDNPRESVSYSHWSIGYI